MSLNEINTSKTCLINTVKVLLYKENLNLIEKIKFDDDEIFLDPILFSYFNSKKNNKFPKKILNEILQGYFFIKAPPNVTYSLNKNQVAYIPKIGYFKKNQKTPYDSILVKGDFEIVKEIHPTQEKYFTEFYKGHTLNQYPEHNSVWKSHYKEVFNAIDIIKKHIPQFYNELAFANKKIYLHDNPKILNFTSIETLGMLHFYVIGESNLIYFIEELIHQGSHNFFYYLIHDRKDYFKIDVENLLMRDFTKQKWDYRSIYSAFHGLYTVTQRVVYFDKLLVKNVFSGREKHELLGRLTDQFSRFRTGLELLNLEKTYTPKGMKLYNRLDKKCASILKKYAMLTDEFDLSNRDVDFRYDVFYKQNLYEDFQTKDLNNYYKF